jgi:hypothetical protein
MDKDLAEAKLGRDNGLGRRFGLDAACAVFQITGGRSGLVPRGGNDAALGWQNIMDAVLALSVVHTRLVQVWLQEKRRRE